MTGLDDALNEWLSDVKSAQKLSIAEQTKITQAGAAVYKNRLISETKSRHYSNHKDATYGHMADSIILTDTDIDGSKRGVNTVGFDSYHANNARRLNNGTKRIRADHFIDNVRDSSVDDVLTAESSAYHKIMKQKGLD